jgi:hypothetical protein
MVSARVVALADGPEDYGSAKVHPHKFKITNDSPLSPRRIRIPLAREKFVTECNTGSMLGKFGFLRRDMSLRHLLCRNHTRRILMI